MTSDPFCSKCSVLGGSRGGGERDEILVWFMGAGGRVSTTLGRVSMTLGRVSMTLGRVSMTSGGWLSTLFTSLPSCNLLIRGAVMGEEPLDPERELLLETLLNA